MPEGGVALERDASPECDRYRLLLEITDLVARAKSLPDAFKELASPVLALTGGELLNVSLHDPRGDRMLTQYWKKNQESGEFDALPVDEAAAGWAWKHQEPIAIPDTELEQRFPGSVHVLLNHGVRSYIALPMSTPSGHFGALGLGKNVPGLLKGEDVEFLSRIALMGALALEKERTHRAFEEQQSLVAIGREVSSCLELEKLLPAILSSVRSIARYDRAVLCLLDEDGKHVHVYGDALEWEPFVNHGSAIPLEHSLSARAIQTRNVAFFTAGDLRVLNDPLAKAMVEGGVRSVCSVPLVAGNQIWGALNPSSMIENAFGAPEIEYLQQVANQIAAALHNAHAYREIAQFKDRLAQEKRYLEYEIRSANRSEDIVGNSPALKRVLDYAAIVADTDSTVLITGETGTGKERIARLIHSMSQRKERNFIKVNCAAIPTGLLESELFGHEKGAFTGAISQKLGRLELADMGTLLLDEVGEIPLEIQSKLLRILQEKRYERVGDDRTRRTNVRVVAATNRDLKQAVAAGRFREDLYYRLNVFPIQVPPLRERMDDIPLLARHFVALSAKELKCAKPRLTRAAAAQLQSYDWPGNVRELRNVIERAVILAHGGVLEFDLPIATQAAPAAPPSLRAESSAGGDAQPKFLTDAELNCRERDNLLLVLEEAKWKIKGPGGAAELLGAKPTTLLSRMNRWGLKKPEHGPS